MSKHLNRLLLLLFSLATLQNSFGKERIRCSSMEVFNRKAAQNPEFIRERDQLERETELWINRQALNKPGSVASLVTIPVVVHVVYNTTDQNVSDAQIQSQIERLNKDYRNLNTDKLSSGHPFFSVAADAQVEFCLAQSDPNGNATNGITRTATTQTEFSDDDSVKYTNKRGENAWNPNLYLNIWVCKLSGTTLGYATLPSTLSIADGSDGVVIDFEAFGTMGTAKTPYNLGRTATHEVGHWLNLKHIWGDDEGTGNICSLSDNVSDTPNQGIATTGCPSATITDACTTTAPGIMYQNYMDYTDDACMVMFTIKQSDRMQAVFSGIRSAIVTSNKCLSSGVVHPLTDKIRIYPNPAENYLTIEGLPSTKSRIFNIDFYNILGEKVYSTTFSSAEYMLEMHNFEKGTYIMTIYNNEFSATQKLTVIK